MPTFRKRVRSKKMEAYGKLSFKLWNSSWREAFEYSWSNCSQKFSTFFRSPQIMDKTRMHITGSELSNTGIFIGRSKFLCDVNTFIELIKKIMRLSCVFILFWPWPSRTNATPWVLKDRTQMNRGKQTEINKIIPNIQV